MVLHWLSTAALAGARRRGGVGAQDFTAVALCRALTGSGAALGAVKPASPLDDDRACFPTFCRAPSGSGDDSISFGGD